MTRPKEDSKLRRIPKAVWDDVDRLVEAYRKDRDMKFDIFGTNKLGYIRDLTTKELVESTEVKPDKTMRALSLLKKIGCTEFDIHGKDAKGTIYDRHGDPMVCEFPKLAPLHSTVAPVPPPRTVAAPVPPPPPPKKLTAVELYKSYVTNGETPPKSRMNKVPESFKGMDFPRDRMFAFMLDDNELVIGDKAGEFDKLGRYIITEQLR